MNKELLIMDLKAVAKLFKVNQGQILSWVENKTFPKPVIKGKNYCFSTLEVTDFFYKQVKNK